MDTLAPDLTARSSGFSGSPNCLPVSSSNLAIALFIPAVKFSVNSDSPNIAQVFTPIVNPGGVGSPSLEVIAHRLAPLPPTTSETSAMVPKWG